MGGYDDLGYAEGASDVDGVHRARPSEREQRAIAPVDAALDGNTAKGANHRGDCDADDAKRGLFDRHGHRLGETGERRARPMEIELQPAAQHPVAVEVSQQQAGVAHGGKHSATPIAGRPRRRPGALGTDEERPVVEPRDRTAPGADGLDADHWLADRPFAERTVAGDLGAAIDDQAYVGRRAAHVEADDVIQAKLARDVARRGDAGGRTRHRERERQLSQGGGRGHAAG